MRPKAPEIDIIPNDHLVFIHLPKTAGTTFNSILERLLTGYSSCPEYFEDRLIHSDLDDLRKIEVFRGHFHYALFSDIIFPNGFIGLTFLRDPVERVRSNFRFIHQLLKRDSQPELSEFADELEQIRNLSLSQFLERSDLRINKTMINVQTDFIGSSMPSPVAFSPFLLKIFHGEGIVSQVRFNRFRARVRATSRKKNNGAITTQDNLNIAKKRIMDIAFLGLVERFQDSLFLLSYTFGWRPIFDAPHLNVTLGNESPQAADPGLLERIRDREYLDNELYQFGQDVFEMRYSDMTQTLLNRYGKKEHARLPLPLPGEVLVSFLEQHYLDRRDRRYQQEMPRTNEVLYQPGMKVEDPFGWYAPEFSPEYGLSCWSGPGLISGFDLPCPSSPDIQISFCVLKVLQPEIIEQLSLNINDFPVPLIHREDPDGSYVFTSVIPPDAVSGQFLKLVFMVPMTVLPRTVDPGNLDTRHLGILLNWVKLKSNKR